MPILSGQPSLNKTIGFWLSGGILLFSWLIANHYLPWTAFYQDFLAGIALLILATTILFRRDLFSPLTLTRPALILFAVAFIPVAQLASGLIRFSGDAWISFLYLGGLTLAYLAGQQFRDEAVRLRLFRTLAWLFIAGGLLSLYLALHQLFMLDTLSGTWVMDAPPGDRVYANLAQPNNLATLFCLGLAATLYLRETGELREGTVALLVVTLLLGIALTKSRTSYLVLIGLLAWVIWKRKGIPLRTRPLEVVAGILLFVGISLSVSPLTDWLGLGGGVAITERTQPSLRPVIWAQAIDAISRSPWIGYGWNQVSSALTLVADQHPPSRVTEYSHNFFLDLLIWNGVILGGLLIALLGWWFLDRARRCPDRECWFGLTLILFVGIHAMLEYPQAYAYFLLPLGLCAGTLDAGFAFKRYQMSGTALGALVLGGWVLFGWISAEYLMIEKDYRNMRLESIGIRNRDAASEPPPPLLLTQLSDYIRYARTPAREQMTEQELEWMRNIAHRYPHPPALFRLALAQGLNGQYQEAGLTLQRLRKLGKPKETDNLDTNWALLVQHYPRLANVPLTDTQEAH